MGYQPQQQAYYPPPQQQQQVRNIINSLVDVVALLVFAVEPSWGSFLTRTLGAPCARPSALVQSNAKAAAFD